MTSLQKPISRAVEKRQKRSMKLQIERVVYRAVDQRDQYRCRECGARCSPSAASLLDRAHRHHIIFRSAGGETTTANVLTLCSEAHADVHAHRLHITGDANFPVRFEKDGRIWQG
jgi:5-methylcytosine-specific restriction endonuclease McrA